MADEKDNDSAPDKDAPESSAAQSGGSDGSSPVSPDSPDLEYDGTTDDRADDADSDGEAGEDRELVGVGARKQESGGSEDPSGSATKAGPGKKDRATPKQKSGSDQPKRTTPAAFVRGSVAELKKVVYPTGSQLANYFVVVLVFVLIVIAIVTGLDYGFGWLMLKVFG
ncbi:MAG TPA: preprotein translocase subunit SecE [Microlunatus sp.]